uniref:hypothetical protein n=1 Tax=uncultured Draconibacterium sp. TaxID=1573823 RepID=UPI003217FBB5
MRTLLIVVLLFSGVRVFAQQNPVLKSLPKIEFDDFRFENKDIFDISPTFKIDTLFEKPLIFPEENKRKSFEQYLNQGKPVFISSINRMPIAKPFGNYWNMPVAVPDPSVRYYIKEKKIDGWGEPMPEKGK